MTAPLPPYSQYRISLPLGEGQGEGEAADGPAGNARPADLAVYILTACRNVLYAARNR